jgi:hypothetical protein
MSQIHGPTRLQQFLHQVNGVKATIKFTVEVEANDTIPGDFPYRKQDCLSFDYEYFWFVPGYFTMLSVSSLYTTE